MTSDNPPLCITGMLAINVSIPNLTVDRLEQFRSPQLQIQTERPTDVGVAKTNQSANLLTINSSKTEFLLIGLKKQLDKIHSSSLNTTHSARNLGFIFDEHLTFSDGISAISKACYYHIRQLRCIRPYLIPPQRAPLPPPSFTPNLILLYTSYTEVSDYPPTIDSKLSCPCSC